MFTFIRLLFPLIAGFLVGNGVFFRGVCVSKGVLAGGLAGLFLLLLVVYFSHRYSLRWMFGCILYLFVFLGGAGGINQALQQTLYSFSEQKCVYRAVVSEQPEPKEHSFLCRAFLEERQDSVCTMPVNRKVLLYISKDSLSEGLRSGDLLAMEAVTGYVRLWSAYAAKHENLKLEIRTKCAGHAMWDLPCLSNVIYAFTMSPQKMIDAFEKETPSAFARIVCAAEGLKKGFPVRLCFDPMLYLPSWKTDYLQLLSQIDRIFGDRMLHDGWEKLVDVSVGTFRISQEYMKKLRRVEPFAPAVQYPYVNCNGVYQYPPELLKEMESFMITELTQRMNKENIYHE